MSVNLLNKYIKQCRMRGIVPTWGGLKEYTNKK